MSMETTKEHILLSAIFAIEKYGLPNLTTRLIAEEAGVNNAALHYYFGTKETLINAALKQTSQHMLEDVESIMGGVEEIDQRVKTLLNYIIDGVIRYPNIIRAYMLVPLYYDEEQHEVSTLLEKWVALTTAAINPYLPDQNPRELQFNLNMILSFIMMSGMFNSPAEDYGWLDLEDEKDRRLFVDQAALLLLKKLSFDS